MKLEIENVRKTFAHRFALNGISCVIEQCCALAILGPSGCGKSTLLRLIAGLDHPDEGRIIIDDHEVLFEESHLLMHRRKLGVVFQSFNLFPHLTVLQNIELPLHRVHGLSSIEAKERALQFLTRFGLQEHANKKPATLSGGQRQRVAIVRAVAINARLVLFDEPTSALDPLMTSEVLDLILELRHEGISIILVSHHIGFVRKVADWVLFLEEGQALESLPTSQFFTAPSTPQAKHFLEKVLKY